MSVGLSLFGGASSEVRRCKCSVVVKARASFLPEIFYISLRFIPPRHFRQDVWHHIRSVDKGLTVFIVKHHQLRDCAAAEALARSECHLAAESPPARSLATAPSPPAPAPPSSSALPPTRLPATTLAMSWAASQPAPALNQPFPSNAAPAPAPSTTALAPPYAASSAALAPAPPPMASDAAHTRPGTAAFSATPCATSTSTYLTWWVKAAVCLLITLAALLLTPPPVAPPAPAAASSASGGAAVLPSPLPSAPPAPAPAATPDDGLARLQQLASYHKLRSTGELLAAGDIHGCVLALVHLHLTWYRSLCDSGLSTEPAVTAIKVVLRTAGCRATFRRGQGHPSVTLHFPGASSSAPASPSAAHHQALAVSIGKARADIHGGARPWSCPSTEGPTAGTQQPSAAASAVPHRRRRRRHSHPSRQLPTSASHEHGGEIRQTLTARGLPSPPPAAPLTPAASSGGVAAVPPSPPPSAPPAPAATPSASDSAVPPSPPPAAPPTPAAAPSDIGTSSEHGGASIGAGYNRPPHATAHPLVAISSMANRPLAEAGGGGHAQARGSASATANSCLTPRQREWQLAPHQRAWLRGVALASPALAAAIAPLQPPLPADGAAAPAASSGGAALASPALLAAAVAPLQPPRCTPRNCFRPRRCVPASLPCLPPPAAAAAARRRCCRPLRLVVADLAASSLIHSARRLRPSSRGGASGFACI